MLNHSPASPQNSVYITPTKTVEVGGDGPQSAVLHVELPGWTGHRIGSAPLVRIHGACGAVLQVQGCGHCYRVLEQAHATSSALYLRFARACQECTMGEQGVGLINVQPLD